MEISSNEMQGYPASMMYLLERALEEVTSHVKYVLLVFLLTSIAGVFNAWHILVSNFYAFVPPHWCIVPELQAAGWTPHQIKDVSSVIDVSDSVSEGFSCYIIGWNYTLFVELGYESTLDYIHNTTSYPDNTPCTEFYYEESVPFSSVVSQWDLVCERKVQKSNVQGSIAVGKFVGGLICGFVSDMYGRKPIFLFCCVIYFVAGVCAAFTDTFWLFLLARFCTGIAGAGCYEIGFTLLEEFISKKHRAALGCMFNLSYPIGHITLPGLSLLFPNWRHLQLAISLPMVIFLLHFWLLPESPRWLVVHGRPEQAWKVIKRFSKNYEDNLPGSLVGTVQNISEGTKSLKAVKEDIDRYIPSFSGQLEQGVESTISGIPNLPGVESDTRVSITDKLSKNIQNIFLLFSSCELCKRITISIFNFVVASLVYYVLALNATNFKLNQYMYTFIAGWVGIPGYIFPLFIMFCMGRKGASSLLFLLSGLSLVVIAAVPRGNKHTILILAMVGRFTNVAVFGLVTVYCAELFPTIVRNSAIGVSLAMSQLGSIYAPYIVDFLGPHGWYLPSTLCGIQTIFASVLILLLPETKGKPFPNTLEDVEEQSDKVSLRNCCKFS